MEKAAPKHNYQVDLERIIRRLERTGEVPTLLLHACCAPCSSYTIEYLSQYFKITLFYYNPNIAPAERTSKKFRKRFKSTISPMKDAQVLNEVDKRTET